MIHKEEIKYWAEQPDGTRVWCHEDGNIEYWKLLCCSPEWFPQNIYIVDNEWATLRKAQSEGKQLQLSITGEVWKDKELTYSRMPLDEPEWWRIKPEEPVYEYQWLYPYSTPNGDYFGITEHLKESQAEKEWIKIPESKRKD